MTQTESLAARVESLEKVVRLQQEMLDRLATALAAHQAIFDHMVAQASAAPMN